MRKNSLSVIVSFMLVLTLCLPSFAAVEIRDVPTSHWSYSAIQKLVDKGYLSLYQDKTFRGENPVDRFTFAVVEARLISEMSVAPAPEAPKKTDSQDLEVLKKLTTEFRDELVQLATVDESIRTSFVAASKEITVLREDLNRVLVQVYQLQQSTSAIAETADGLGLRLDALEAHRSQDVQNLQNLQAQVDQLNSSFEGLDARLGSLQTKVDDEVLTRASGTYIRQQAMEKELQELKQEFDSYRRNSDTEIADLRTKNQWLTMGVIGGVLLGLVVK